MSVGYWSRRDGEGDASRAPGPEPGPPATTSFALGALLAAAVGAALAFPCAVYLHRRGIRIGREAERERFLSKERAFAPEPLEGGPVPPAPGGLPAAPRHGQCMRDEPGAAQAGSRAPDDPGEGRPSGAAPEVAAVEDFPRGPRLFTAMDCARVVWPMEIVPAGTDGVPRPHLRARQGINRITRPGEGLAEFVFRVHRPAMVAIYVHCMYSDDCGNSLECAIDGGPTAYVGNAQQYGTWLWDHSHRLFSVGPGLHRLTLRTLEDGVLFDKVVVSSRSPQELALTTGLDEYLDAVAPSRPPLFEEIPAASETLPPIGAVTAQAFAGRSLVIGSGHENAVGVYVRLNAERPVSGMVHVRSPGLGTDGMREFHLTPSEPSRLMGFDLELHGGRGRYHVPVKVETYVQGARVHVQVLNFVSPLTWAFLGPFPDPEGLGLDLPLPPDGRIGELGRLPPLGGLTWRIVGDGGCYDDLGVVDLNRVFGVPNVHWREFGGDGRAPAVAYAVTALAEATKHDTVAFAGDDSIAVWQNGRPLLRVGTAVPIETSRQVLGLKLDDGPSTFVFKIAQSGFYWQILFEPDESFPYSHPDHFRGVPLDLWP
jgi:hypothetical protein